MKTLSLLMKMEEANPSYRDFSQNLYDQQPQNHPIQLYHILFSEKSLHAMKPLTMTLNSKSYQKLHEVRIWKSGLAPADAGTCDCDHLWGSHSEINCHLWRERAQATQLSRSKLHHCVYQPQWQDIQNQGQLARIQHWSQQSMFQFGGSRANGHPVIAAEPTTWQRGACLESQLCPPRKGVNSQLRARSWEAHCMGHELGSEEEVS